MIEAAVFIAFVLILAFIIVVISETILAKIFTDPNFFWATRAFIVLVALVIIAHHFGYADFIHL